jgi:hypothetical protein
VIVTRVARVTALSSRVLGSATAGDRQAGCECHPSR